MDRARRLRLALVQTLRSSGGRGLLVAAPVSFVLLLVFAMAGASDRSQLDLMAIAGDDAPPTTTVTDPGTTAAPDRDASGAPATGDPSTDVPRPAGGRPSPTMAEAAGDPATTVADRPAGSGQPPDPDGVPDTATEGGPANVTGSNPDASQDRATGDRATNDRATNDHATGDGAAAPGSPPSSTAPGAPDTATDTAEAPSTVDTDQHGAAGAGWTDGMLGSLAVAAGLGLAGLGVAALVVGAVRFVLGLFRSDGDDDPAGPVLGLAGGLGAGTALDRLRHELETEPDPGAAIRRAYAIVEGGFGNVDLARFPSESSFDYLERALGFLDGVESGLAELTGLFLIARYSNHPASEDMRRAAIDAVIELRFRYRTALPVGDDPVKVGT